MYINYFFLLSTIFHVIYTYKILVVNPKIAYSHVNFFSQIADILTDAGHDVTVLTIEMDPTITHPGAYKAKVISVPVSNEVKDMFSDTVSGDFLWNLTPSIFSQIKLLTKSVECIKKQSLDVLYNEELTEIIRKEKFDIGIAEAFNKNIFGLLKVMGIKTYVCGLSMSLIDTLYRDFGLPFPSSFIPCQMAPYTDKMTYLERFQNFISHHIGSIIFSLFDNVISIQSEINSKYGEGFFDSQNAVGDCSFVIINSNPFLDIPGPKTPKMIEVSGIGIKDSKPLSSYWNEILSLRNQTVLISFGTFAKTINMPQDFKDGILKTIKRLTNITFILKYENPDDGTGKDIENLVISKWLPQSDLLNDSRLSLFVTHGGMGSITELSFKGVPAVAIPLMGDQLRNSKLLEKHKTGIVMNKLDLVNPEVLAKHIKTILNDETYKKNAQIVSRRLNKRPIGSKELLIKHVEFAAEFGKLDVLDLGSRNMSTIKYYNLDIIIPLFLGTLSIIFLLIFIIFKSVKKCLMPKIKKD
ncbi:UDP-glucuronosyl/UDP-glucosyltransferase family-containing protein [Strongyloides ratti]|uniref:glucuronosyltransferase n=1 Tax=Strongyloides ratti TaxID=34506 RepID=A0A090MZG7_STRRB|nr:UDP-glucuronosyl/UDP-glucosyltransferase family-containing protein [Strongyloides ratti]CEF68904.1 UDP-glucuronosyl/UDP-glucosyltransferase family-containing protein [Strongyloides ratti]